MVELVVAASLGSLLLPDNPEIRGKVPHVESRKRAEQHRNPW